MIVGDICELDMSYQISWDTLYKRNWGPVEFVGSCVTSGAISGVRGVAHSQ